MTGRLIASNVCEAVNTAFSDNPAAGCAVGVDGSVLSVVMRQQDLDSMPTQTPGLIPSGRPTLKTLNRRERVLWWLTAMGSNIVATLKEGFATASGITAIDLAVLTHLPDTQRGAVASQAERASSILVTRSTTNPQVQVPGVVRCLNQWAGGAPPTHPQGPLTVEDIDTRGDRLELGSLPRHFALRDSKSPVGGAVAVPMAAFAEVVGAAVRGTLSGGPRRR
ncbi:hypothetical protein ABZV31_27475 [Streptomyces sp. NPDC005202]|uniref:hypothetical protein n=1 Tax=Streptomyces sp. NPDC005202 TaxID=3157021 RepID=UPI0033A2D2A1